MLDSFGWGNNSPAVQFMMMPMYADLLKVQAIEFNDQIRKSAYSFELVNNKLRIFPNPTGDSYKLHFKYLVKKDRDSTLQGTTDGVITDYSNAPFNNMLFKDINEVGKQWIKKYGPTKAFEFHQDAYDGKVRGLLSHTNVIKGKMDVYPDPRLVDVIMSL